MQVVGGQVGAELPQGGEIVLRGPHPRDLFGRAHVFRHEQRGERGHVVGRDRGDRRGIRVDPLVVGQVAQELGDPVPVGLFRAGRQAEIAKEHLDGGAQSDRFVRRTGFPSEAAVRAGTVCGSRGKRVGSRRVYGPGRASAAHRVRTRLVGRRHRALSRADSSLPECTYTDRIVAQFEVSVHPVRRRWLHHVGDRRRCGEVR